MLRRDRLETWNHALSPWCLEASSGISRAGIWDYKVFASRGESFPWGHPQTRWSTFRRRKCSAFGLDSLSGSLKSTRQTCRHTHTRLVVSMTLAVTVAPAKSPWANTSPLGNLELHIHQWAWPTSVQHSRGAGSPATSQLALLTTSPLCYGRLSTMGTESGRNHHQHSWNWSSLPFLPNYILVEHSFFSGPPNTETPGSPRWALVLRSMLVSQGTTWPLQSALPKNESSTFSSSLTLCIFSHKACPEGW